MKRKIRNFFEDQIIGRYLKKYNYDVKSNFLAEDIFLVGYPKSGNTWLQNLVAGLIFGIDTQYLPDKLTQELVPPVKNRRIFKRFLPFNCFKSHELPHSDYKRVVLLVRDGRDVMPSYQSMNQKMGKEFTLSEMIKEGKGIYPCSWVEFYRSWVENPHNSEILVLKYEDLVNDTMGSLHRLCKFLKIERDNITLQRVIDGNQIEKMREKSDQFGTDHRTWKKGKQFYRKGKVGSYSEDFKSDLLPHFEKESYDMLKHFEYI